MTVEAMKSLMLLAALLSGCTFGFGSPYVGQWKAREAIEFEVCVENAAGECEQKQQVTKREPNRKFWGFQLSYPMIGVGFPKIGDDQQTSFRMDMNAEYLWGEGNFALGVRHSVVFELNTGNFFLSTPVMLMSHVGLSDRLAAYAGAGYSYYNQYQQSEVQPDGTAMVTSTDVSYVGGRVLGGLQLVGSRSHRNSRILYTVEADTALSSIGGQTYRSFGFTLSIGLFL